MTSIIVKTRYKILLAIAVLLITAVLSLAFLPWKAPIQKKLQGALEANGFQNVHLTLSDIGFKGATLDNVSVGDENQFTLNNVTLAYSPLELWHGNLRALVLNGLSIDVRQKNGKWSVQGFENKESSSDNFHLPVTEDEIFSIPLNHVTLDDSRINFFADKWKATLPLKLEWVKAPTPEISMHSDDVSFNSKALIAQIAKAKINVKNDIPHDSWQGVWNIDEVELEAGEIDIPTMKGNGTVQADAENLTLSGDLKSKDAAYRAAFTLDYALTNPQQAVLKLTQASMPWHGGKLSLKNVDIPLSGKESIRLNIHVDKVSIDEFMRALTGKRVTATGVVSGTMPLIIAPDGTLTFGKVALKADKPGTIVIPGDVIPGDNEQITLTRKILNNFHYDDLSLSLSSGKDNDMSILMVLGGNNPDVLDGRAVKLNINLTGDILDFIQQNAMLITDPQKLLKQERK